jgi:hypothetical protein
MAQYRITMAGTWIVFPLALNVATKRKMPEVVGSSLFPRCIAANYPGVEDFPSTFMVDYRRASRYTG